MWRHVKSLRTNGSLQIVDQLATKHGLQHSPGHEDGFLRCDKSARRIDAACGHQTMHVRMNAEVSSPRVQRRNDARFRSNVRGINEQCFNGPSRGLHQQVGKRGTVKPPEHIQLLGNREDDVNMLTGKKLLS